MHKISVIIEQIKKLKADEFLVILSTYDNSIISLFFYHKDILVEDNGFFSYSKFDEKKVYKKFKVTENLTYQILPLLEKKNYIKNNIAKLIEKELQSDRTNNAKLIVEDLNKDCGKIIKSHNNEDEILICAVSSTEDYYFVTVNLTTRKIIFSSCCCGYKLSDNQYSLSQEERQQIYDEVIEKIDETEDVIFTNIQKFLEEK